MNVSRSKDFWAGIMFLGFAAVAMVAARGYTPGTAGRMGPGYFPMVLGLLLGVLGLIIAARSLLTVDNPAGLVFLLGSRINWNDQRARGGVGAAYPSAKRFETDAFVERDNKRVGDHRVWRFEIPPN